MAAVLGTAISPERKDVSASTNESTTTGNDASSGADGTGESLSASAYEVIKQYSEAELHGEYEEQYFGFTADSVADNLFNAAVHRMWAALSDTRRLVQTKFPGEMSEEQFEVIESKLMAKFQWTIDKAFDKLAIYLKTNIFKIPGNVVLPEDKVQIDCKCTAQEEESVDKEIEELEAAIQNAAYVNACLRQEIKDNAELLKEMEHVLQHISSVEEAFIEAGVTNMKEVFQTMKCQVVELREIVETIRPISESPEKIRMVFISSGNSTENRNPDLSRLDSSPRKIRD